MKWSMTVTHQMCIDIIIPIMIPLLPQCVWHLSDVIPRINTLSSMGGQVIWHQTCRPYTCISFAFQPSSVEPVWNPSVHISIWRCVSRNSLLHYCTPTDISTSCLPSPGTTTWRRSEAQISPKTVLWSHSTFPRLVLDWLAQRRFVLR